MEQTKMEKTQKYIELFEKTMETHPLREGEQIKQCLDSSMGQKYYNPKWAASNLGEIYSITAKGLKPLKAFLAGSRLNQSCVINRFHGKRLHVRTSRLQAVYWADRTILGMDERYPIKAETPPEEVEQIFAKHWEVHHIISLDASQPYWINDRADNLQFISKHDHATLTHIHSLGALKRTYTILAPLGNQDLQLDANGAKIFVQSVIGLPPNADRTLAEDIILICSQQGRNPLPSLRSIFGEQVQLKSEFAPLILS